MIYSSRFLVVTMLLAACVFSTSFTSETAHAQRRILTKSTLKISKLKVSVTPTSGQSGSTATVTVTGATPNGKAVRITIGGSGHTYDADSKGKIVTKEVISGLVGDKVKIEVEDVSKGAYPPYPKGEAIYTITGRKREFRTNQPLVKSGAGSANLPLGRRQ